MLQACDIFQKVNSKSLLDENFIRENNINLFYPVYIKLYISVHENIEQNIIEFLLLLCDKIFQDNLIRVKDKRLGIGEELQHMLP